MGIRIHNVRINNFRSIENLDLKLNMTNLLIGPNNCGKSNFLRAINIALGNNVPVSNEDIYISENEHLNRDKIAIIDLCIIPTDDENERTNNFSDFWTSVFKDKWITNDSTNGDYVGIRTTISFDIMKNDYVVKKDVISVWGKDLGDATINHKRENFTSEMLTYISSYYVDAQRDAVSDIKNKKSYFGKITSTFELDENRINELEEMLNSVNEEVVASIPSLKQTEEIINMIGTTIGTRDSKVEIQPLIRRMSDLHKGMDVVFKDGKAAKLSISQNGMGTRSWMTFLTLNAFLQWENNKNRQEDPEIEKFNVLTMEEPEAHLHPQAQRQLYGQMCRLNGQKIISTHSPSIIAQAELSSIIVFKKVEGKTKAHSFAAMEYSQEEISKMRREVINTHGSLLFSNGVVLCEGITEEQALPIFFEKYFGVNPICLGINIIGIGGQNYKTYLNLIKNFDIPWFIFSDGESRTIKNVRSAVLYAFSDNIENMSNVIVLDNNEDYEKHLINNGYAQHIINAINKYNSSDDFFTQYINDHNHEKLKRIKTNGPICETCHQPIYKDVLRNYDGAEGIDCAVYDCCTSGKAKYAVSITEEIIENAEENNKIPPKIMELFDVIAEKLEINKLVN